MRKEDVYIASMLVHMPEYLGRTGASVYSSINLPSGVKQKYKTRRKPKSVNRKADIERKKATK